MELDLWMNKLQERTQELKTSVVQSISLCLKCIFMYILTNKFIKNWKKIKQAKNLKDEFCWIKRAPKNKRARQLWDIQYIFLALFVYDVEVYIPMSKVTWGQQKW